MPQFSLRTLLILSAMPAVLLATWPFTRTLEVPGNSLAGPSTRTVITQPFQTVAIIEAQILICWACYVAGRRQRKGR